MNRLIYDKSGPENIINHNRSFVTDNLLSAFFIYHTLEIIRNYISIENLKSKIHPLKPIFKSDMHYHGNGKSKSCDKMFSFMNYKNVSLDSAL